MWIVLCVSVFVLRKLLFKCVAVYWYSYHCELVFVKADEAYHIGAAASSQSYLNKQKIIDVAKASGAQVSYILMTLRSILKYIGFRGVQCWTS